MSRRRLGMWIPIAVGILIEVGVAIEVNLTSDKVLPAPTAGMAGVARRAGAAARGDLPPAAAGAASSRSGPRGSRSPAPDEPGQEHPRRHVQHGAGRGRSGQLDLRVTVALPPGPERWKRFGRAVERTAEMRMNALPDYVDQSLDGRALIIGEPGGGKSMLMRTIALRSVERSQEAPRRCRCGWTWKSRPTAKAWKAGCWTRSQPARLPGRTPRHCSRIMTCTSSSTGSTRSRRRTVSAARSRPPRNSCAGTKCAIWS